MDKHSESFGRLLKAGMAGIGYIEAKTQQAVESEIGVALGVAGATLQRYKSGHLPPESASIEQLAEACVQRGLFGRLWLERFLEAARHPMFNARALVARLFPENLAARQPTPRPNLPPPTYAQFVMRQEAYDALCAGLASSLPVTVLCSLGGMGKTSLARAVALDLLSGRKPKLAFRAVAWVSDKDRPGTTNLSVTLDTIARVLDYPGLMALSFSERLREITALLAAQPVLLVIDNAETITDAALFDWLNQVPDPSRVLATTRFTLPLIKHPYMVDLDPMSEPEARQLVANWLPRSRIRLGNNQIDLLMPIAALASGNPKAIELALGLLPHHSPGEVEAMLASDREGVFSELFASAWNLLDEPARLVLLALPLFPASAAADALAFCADLPVAAFQRSAQVLANLSLFDSERGDLEAQPRYNAHPLVRAFSRARFAELPQAQQTRIQQRWLEWCTQVARSVGFCWDDLDRLDVLDDEYSAVQAALHWAAGQGFAQHVIELVEGVRYYTNVRGLWSDDELANYRLRREAARQLGDIDNQALALAHNIQVLSKQSEHAEAAALLAQLLALGGRRYPPVLAARYTGPIPETTTTTAAFEYSHAQALFARSQGDLATALHHWQELLNLSQALGGQKYVVNRRWMATVLLQQGQIEQATLLYQASLADAISIGDTRSITGNTLKLALIYLEHGQLKETREALEQCHAAATRYRDRRRLAEYHWISGLLLLRQEQPTAAEEAITTAFDLFERLGMQQEAAAARHLLDTSAGQSREYP